MSQNISVGASVWLFAAVSLAAWLIVLKWIFRQGRHRPFYLMLFGALIAFWWIGEHLAIRFGKYQYAPFPWWLVLPGGGPSHPDGRLIRFIHLVKSWVDPEVTNCIPPQASWDIPFPVVALETALLFSFIRAAQLWFKHAGPRTALASAGASGLLMLNVMAIVDPVVSTNQWCGLNLNPAGAAAGLGIWHWFATDVHPGYWIGVPLINYVAWFLTAAVFSAVVQLDDDEPQGVAHWFYRRFGVAASIAMAIVALAVLLVIKIGIDKIFVGSTVAAARWHIPGYLPQSAVIAVLSAVGLSALVLFGQTRHRPKFEWTAAFPQVAMFTFCLGALLYKLEWRMALVWTLTAVIAVAAIAWPFLRSIDRTAGPIADSGAVDDDQ